MHIASYDFGESLTLVHHGQFTDLFVGDAVAGQSEPQRVVVKIKKPTAHTEHANHVLEHETMLAKKVQPYRNCANVLCFGTMDDAFPKYAGQPYLISPFIEGPTLEVWLTSHCVHRGTVAIETVAQIIFVLAKTLERIHHLEVVHHDIKPSNIVLREGTDPVIIDFGTGRVFGDGTRWHNTEFAYGTPRYVAPEQACNLIPLATFCPAPDVYGLGLILFEMLCGQPAFPNRGGKQTLVDVDQPVSSVYYVPPPNIDDVLGRNDIPSFLKDLCQHCLEMDWEIRISAAEVAEKIDDWRKSMFPAIDMSAVNAEVVEQIDVARRLQARQGRIQFWGIGIAAVLAFIFFAMWVQRGVENRTDVLPDPQVKATQQEKVENLFSLVDLSRHVVKGRWHADGVGIRCEEDPFARILIPKVPDGDYDLAIRLTPKLDDPEVNFYLPTGDRYAMITLGGEQPIPQLQNAGPESQRFGDTCILQAGREYLVDAHVQHDISGWEIILAIDGRRVGEWKCIPLDEIENPQWSLPGPSLAVGVHEGKVVFHQAALNMLSGNLHDLKEFHPSSILQAGSWVQLLDYVRLNEHAVHGHWRSRFRATKALGFNGGHNGFERVVIPATCETSYELTVLFTALGADESQFLIPVGDSNCSVWIDHVNSCFGIEHVVEPKQSPDSFQPFRRFVSFQRANTNEVISYLLEITVSVEENHQVAITAELKSRDGSAMFTWSGDCRHLSQRHDWRLFQGCRLGFGSHAGPNFICSVCIRSDAAVRLLTTSTNDRSERNAEEHSDPGVSFTKSAIESCKDSLEFSERLGRTADADFERSCLSHLETVRISESGK